MKWKLLLSAIVAVLSIPIAAIWGSFLPGAEIIGPLVAALAGLYASMTLMKSPNTRSILEKLEEFKPSEEFIEAWEEAGTTEKRNWRGRSTGSKVDRTGFSWIFVAGKAVITQLWATQRKWTAICGSLFALFVVSAVSGIPILSVLGAALGLYFFTAAVFTIITFFTEEKKSPTAG